MSPNLIRETTRMDRTYASFCFSILCYLDYLKSVVIQNKCVFNKYKSYKLKCRGFFKKRANIVN